MPRLILFDLDGTLLQPRDPLHSRAFAEVLETVCGSQDGINWTGTSGMVDRAILGLIFERSGMDPRIARSHLTNACRQMGASYARGPVDTESDRTLPGVRALLEQLKEMGVAMGLVTGNVGTIAWGRVQQARLRGFFLAGAFGDEAMHRSTLVKRAIRRCEKSLGYSVSPDDVIVVGDTPRDIAAAHQAGVRCVSVATGEFGIAELAKENPLAVLPDLTATAEVAQLLNSA